MEAGIGTEDVDHGLDIQKGKAVGALFVGFLQPLEGRLRFRRLRRTGFRYKWRGCSVG